MLLQISYDDFQEFASLRKELHKLQVALEFYQKTTAQFNFDDLKVNPSTAASDFPALILTAIPSVLPVLLILPLCTLMWHLSFCNCFSWYIHGICMCVTSNLVPIIILSSYGSQQHSDHPQHSMCICPWHTLSSQHDVGFRYFFCYLVAIDWNWTCSARGRCQHSSLLSWLCTQLPLFSGLRLRVHRANSWL